jgi:hypothetical protein
VTLPFRVSAAGRVRIRLTQVAPVCRSAGGVVVDAERGVNRSRFDGRVGHRPLRDGTYEAETPSGVVRFAIVRGRPTRNPERLAPSVCPPPARASDAERSGVAPSPSGSKAAPPPNADSQDARDGLGALPRVLGTTLTEAAEAAASLHPAFYVLLALAIAALAAATLPARALPVAAAGAALARRRAELTLAGTLSLLGVIVAYWVTLL